MNTFVKSFLEGTKSLIDSKEPVFIGIDPGAKGAIAWIYGDVLTVSDCPIDAKKRVDHDKLRDLVKTQMVDLRNHVAYIEHVHAMPGQGVVSMFSLGGNYNSWLQVLSCNYVKVKEVTPMQWKKKMEVTADKQTSVDKAISLFPKQAHLFTGKRGGLKDGRAEAVLLAYLAKKEWSETHE